MINCNKLCHFTSLISTTYTLVHATVYLLMNRDCGGPGTPNTSSLCIFSFLSVASQTFEGCLSIPSLRLCFHLRLKTLFDLSRVLDLGKIIRAVLQSTGTPSQFKHSWSECRGGSYSYIYLPNSLLIS